MNVTSWSGHHYFSDKVVWRRRLSFCFWHSCQPFLSSSSVDHLASFHLSPGWRAPYCMMFIIWLFLFLSPKKILHSDMKIVINMCFILLTLVTRSHLILPILLCIIFFCSRVNASVFYLKSHNNLILNFDWASKSKQSPISLHKEWYNYFPTKELKSHNQFIT